MDMGMISSDFSSLRGLRANLHTNIRNSPLLPACLCFLSLSPLVVHKAVSQHTTHAIRFRVLTCPAHVLKQRLRIRGRGTHVLRQSLVLLWFFNDPKYQTWALFCV